MKNDPPHSSTALRLLECLLEHLFWFNCNPLTSERQVLYGQTSYQLNPYINFRETIRLSNVVANRLIFLQPEILFYAYPQKIMNVKSLYLWYNTDVAAVTKSDHLYTGEVTL